MPKDDIEALPEIPLADPFFHKCSQVHILLGGDVFPSIMMTGQMNNVCGSLLAQQSISGWILKNPFFSATTTSSNTKVAFHCTVSLEEEISQILGGGKSSKEELCFKLRPILGRIVS